MTPGGAHKGFSSPESINSASLLQNLTGMKQLSLRGLLLSLCAIHGSVFAWDYEGHRAVNQLALKSLPTNFPSFVLTPEARERIAFLAGEMDRWRNSPDVSFKHASGPDHYLDLEQLNDYGLKASALPIFRYDFVAELALSRKAHPERFAEINAGRNEDHTRQLVGFLPWAIVEDYAKLKSSFSYLKAFQEDGGTAEEIRNAQENVIYTMGLMGHVAGDAGQPLHTTVHHHGWVGANPEHYSTNGRIHSWIDGGYFSKIGGIKLDECAGQIRPAGEVRLNGRIARPEEMFQAAMAFILEQNKLVETVYKMDKSGELSGEGETGMKGRAFLEGQIVKSGQFLGDLWYSAWVQAPPDSFLKAQLARRHRPAP
jgi:hypothetical protein